MRIMLRDFLQDETAATAIEYGLIVAVLSLAIIGGVSQASSALVWLWSNNNSRLVQAFQ